MFVVVVVVCFLPRGWHVHLTCNQYDITWPFKEQNLRSALIADYIIIALCWHITASSPFVTATSSWWRGLWVSVNLRAMLAGDLFLLVGLPMPERSMVRVQTKSSLPALRVMRLGCGLIHYSPKNLWLRKPPKAASHPPPPPPLEVLQGRWWWYHCMIQYDSNLTRLKKEKKKQRNNNNNSKELLHNLPLVLEVSNIYG